MPSALLAGAAPAMLRKRRRQQRKADAAGRRLTRAEDALEQARRARENEQRKTRAAEKVSRDLDQIEERNDISGLIADIFGFERHR